jgi:hypothetical protein
MKAGERLRSWRRTHVPLWRLGDIGGWVFGVCFDPKRHPCTFSLPYWQMCADLPLFGDVLVATYAAPFASKIA